MFLLKYNIQCYYYLHKVFFIKKMFIGFLTINKIAF